METEPPFSRVGVVGLGLMGGSIALAARQAWPNIEVVGFDRVAQTAAAAVDQTVHKTVRDLADLASSDLIVLAVPLSAIVDLLPRLAELPTRAVVTDIGSTKRQVMAAASAVGLAGFVGGHPMAGSERAGLDHARTDLFAGRPWLLVRGSGDRRACARVEQFVAGIGAMPQWIDAEAHDRTIAYVSHLPQLMAVALMNAAQDAVGDQGLSAGGRAFGEMTRLASSPPDLWQGILSGNADFVAEALGAFANGLPAERDLRDRRWIHDAFDRAGASRAQLTEVGRSKS